MTRNPGTVAAAALLPPLGVHLDGRRQRDVWIATLLTVLGFLPGVAFALHTVLLRQRQEESRATPLPAT